MMMTSNHQEADNMMEWAVKQPFNAPKAAHEKLERLMPTGTFGPMLVVPGSVLSFNEIADAKPGMLIRFNPRLPITMLERVMPDNIDGCIAGWISEDDNG